MNNTFQIGNKIVGGSSPTYFVADIGANHDGSLERALELINLAKEAGSDAAKFQHFDASTIVSDFGFKNLKGGQTHQDTWKKTVYEVYKDASISRDWTPTLKSECEKLDIEFFTSPYAPDLVDEIDPFVSVHKIGSGDITWHEIIEKIAKKQKPTLLATGASNIMEVIEAVEAFAKHNDNLCLMQCNTNYTGDLENFKYVNLNVLTVFKSIFPDVVLGLSDHTPGHSTTLGAVALGAKVVEKHFTDDKSRNGPDHHFAMNPADWREMVDRTRELEYALGKHVKVVEHNEVETVVVQRRSIRASVKLQAGDTLTRENLIPLRPCPPDAFPLSRIDELIGKKLRNGVASGECIRQADLE